MAFNFSSFSPPTLHTSNQAFSITILTARSVVRKAALIAPLPPGAGEAGGAAAQGPGKMPVQRAHEGQDGEGARGELIGEGASVGEGLAAFRTRWRRGLCVPRMMREFAPRWLR